MTRRKRNSNATVCAERSTNLTKSASTRKPFSAVMVAGRTVSMTMAIGRSPIAANVLS